MTTYTVHHLPRDWQRPYPDYHAYQPAEVTSYLADLAALGEDLRTIRVRAFDTLYGLDDDVTAQTWLSEHEDAR